MRVGVNARLLHSPDLRGWNRYSVNLLAELTRLGLPLVLYTDRPIHDDHLSRFSEGDWRVVQSPPMSYAIWEQVWLPRQTIRDGVAVLHSPYNFGLPAVSRCRRVLTLHDAIDLAYRPEAGSIRLRLSPSFLKDRLHHAVARTRAHRIITVSRHAQSDLVAHFRIPESKIDVISEAADPRFHLPIEADTRQRVRKRYDLGKPYLFYVGGWEGRKNLPFLLKAFAEAAVSRLDLVLAGGKDSQRAALIALAESLGIASSIRLLGWVEEADLPSLYGEAVGFVYPSEYEGFGLQICEAMAVGCPVLAADATSLPEVLGTGGETFPLNSTAILAGLIRKVADDPRYRAELIDKAHRRSADFSWRSTAEQTIETYRRAFHSRRGEHDRTPLRKST